MNNERLKYIPAMLLLLLLLLHALNSRQEFRSLHVSKLSQKDQLVHILVTASLPVLASDGVLQAVPKKS